MTIEPPVAASASAKSAESRSGAKTLVSWASRRACRSSVVTGSIGGMPKALLTRQSTRPSSSSARSTSRTRCCSSVMSVGTTRARRPWERTTSAIFSSRRSVRLTRTRSAPIRAASSPSARPSPGPTPESTTTLSCSRPSAVTTASCGPRSAAGRRCGPPIPRGRPACGTAAPPARRRSFMHLDRGAVRRVEVALEPLPAQHHRAGAVTGGLQPVGDTGALARRSRTASARRGR